MKKIKYTLGTHKLIQILVLIGVLIALSFAIPASKFIAKRDTKRVGYSLQRIKYNLFGPWLFDKNNTELTSTSYHQKYSLSCEVAALHIALDHYNVNVSEDELISRLNFASKDGPIKDPKTGQVVWGDPDLGFVGKIDGSMPSTGYGVYEKPIYDVALNYRNAEILQNANLQSLILQIGLGHPVIVWGTISDGHDTSWVDKDGNKIHAIAGEHARVLVGYEGSADNPTNVILQDPVYGKIRMNTQIFLRNWGLLDNRAVAIY